MNKIERTTSKAAESNASFCVPEWRKIGYDDTYEDAQLLHNCMTKRLKREEDPDYSPDSQADGDSPRSTNGQYFQKPIFQCPECVRSYKSPVRMANHYRDKHPDKDMRGPYPRYTSSHREKRHTYDYSTSSPPLSPDGDYSQYSPYDYNHKHTRQERERFTANENTSQLISPMFHRQAPSSSRSSSSSPYSTSTALVPTSTRSPDASPPATPVDSPSSPHSYVPPSRSPIPLSKLDSKEEKNITIHGRTYELKGIRISTVVDEFKFVECLEKNKQRLHLANIAYSQGLISSEEYSRKQREFLNAFSFF